MIAHKTFSEPLIGLTWEEALRRQEVNRQQVEAFIKELDDPPLNVNETVMFSNVFNVTVWYRREAEEEHLEPRLRPEEESADVWNRMIHYQPKPVLELLAEKDMVYNPAR